MGGQILDLILSRAGYTLMNLGETDQNSFILSDCSKGFCSRQKSGPALYCQEKETQTDTCANVHTHTQL